MSLTENIIEKIINFMEKNQISTDIIQDISSELMKKNINLCFAKLKYPNIEWNDDLPTPLEVLATFMAGKINSDKLITSFGENLKIIKLIKFFTEGNKVKGLENKENRLEFYLDLEDNTKLILEIFYELLKKWNCEEINEK